MTKMKVSLFIKFLSLALIFAPQVLADDYKGKASDIRANTSGNNGILTSSENTVQKALDKIDDVTCTTLSGCVPNAVSASSTTTFTNKTIDADATGNTISNIENENIKASAAIALNKLAAVTASRALVSDGSGFISASAVTTTELGYLSGVTSSVQTQINALASGAGGWTKSGASITNTTLTDKVGIGTATPWSSLHVHGGGIKGELMNKGWEMIPMDQSMNPSGVTFSEVNSMMVADGDLYIGYDIDGSAGVIRSPVYRWDGQTLTHMSDIGTTGHLFNGVAFLIEYKGAYYAGLQSNTPGGGDVYVSTDKAESWTKAFDGDSQFAYSAAVFKGKLYVGSGYNNPSEIYVFDGTTWGTSYAGYATAGLVVSLHVYNGRLFAALGGADSLIISTADGVTWAEEHFNTGYTEFNHFVEFRGKLFANVMGGQNDILVRDNATRTWSIAAADLQGNQCWGMNVYNDVLYVGCSQSPNGAIIFRSKDGYTYETDIQFNTLGTNYEYEAFKMINYNGSMYVGAGGDGRYSANMWRKTDSVGQLLDTDHKILSKFHMNNSGYNFGADQSSLGVSPPTSFNSNVSIGTSGLGTGALSVMGGNVGINTMSPGRLLDVNSNSVNIARFMSTASSGAGAGTANVRFGTDDGAALSAGDKFVTLDFFGAYNALHGHGSSAGITVYALNDWTASDWASRMDFETSNPSSIVRSVRMTIAGSNVGIGSLNPGARLVVVGSGTGTASTLNLRNSSGTLQTAFLDNGNIGIGTAAPTQRFDLATGNARFRYLNCTGNANGGALTADANGNISCSDDESGSGGSGTPSGSNKQLQYNNSGAFGGAVNFVYDSATGNVAIGTDTPTAKLQVVGTVSATTFIGANVTSGADPGHTHTGDSVSGLDISNDTNLGGTSGEIVLTDDTLSLDPAVKGWVDGGTDIHQSDTSDTVAIGSSAANAASFEIARSGSRIPFKISSSASGNGDLMTVTSAGNVGLGTTSPTALNANYLFALNKSSNSARTMAVVNANTGTSAQARFEVKTSDSGGFIAGLPTNYAGSAQWAGRTILVGETGNGVGLVAAAGDIAFLTNSTTRAMTINGSNVGIGSTAPLSRLEVRGGAARVWTGAGTNTNAASSGELYVEGDLEVDGTIYGNGSGITGLDDDGIAFDDNNNDFTATTIGSAIEEFVSVNGSGPNALNAKVDWSQIGGMPAGFADGTDDTGTGGIGDVVSDTTPELGGNLDVNGKSITSSSNGNILLSPNGTGNVGINTINPQSKLQVVGTVSATSFVGPLTGTASGNTTDSGTSTFTNKTIDADGAGNSITNLENENIKAAAAIALNKLAATTASRALVSNSSGFVNASATTDAEIGYVSGVTSAIQTQIDGKQATDADLTSIAANSTGGFLTRTAANTYTPRTITGTSSQITVTNGDGVSGNPTISLPSSVGIGTTTQVGGLSVMSGNVGVGTWSPTQKLQVVGTVLATAFSGDGSAVSNVQATTGDSAASFFGAGTIERVRGGLGADTSAFGAGIIGSDGSNNSIDIDTIAEIETAIGGTNIIVSTEIDTLSEIETLAAGINIIQSTEIDTMAELEALVASANIIQSTEIDTSSELAAFLGDETGTGNAVFSASPVFSGSVGIGTTMTVGGLSVMSGNVGFGTWSPTSRLQVVGTVSATAFVGDGSGLTGIAGGSVGWTDGGINVYNTTTSDNVGIGTTTPTPGFKADVRGNLYISGNVGMGTTSPRTGFDLGSNTLWVSNVSGPAGGIQSFAGNVGIGTTTASELLAVGSTGQFKITSAGVPTAPANAYDATSWNGSTRLTTEDAVRDKFESLSSSSGWTDGGTTLYNTTSTDNVGIGTTTAQELLTIRSADSDILLGSTTNSAFTEIRFFDDSGNEAATFGKGGTSTATPSELFFENITSGAPINFITSGSTTTFLSTGVTKVTPTDTPGTCNAGLEGGIYYDNSLNEFCDCDGSSWAQVDGGGGC